MKDAAGSRPRPKVSVRMITYNHEPFIARAIESVLMQKTDFDVELVIGEDCSTDGTARIVAGYERRFPDRIRLVQSERTVGRLRNYLRTLAACGGEYVALIDGDDYWTSDDKLQRQVEVLDDHPDCSLCIHNVLMIYEDGRVPRLRYRESLGEVLTLEDVLREPFISTVSVVFRHGLVREFPPLFYPLPFCDWPLYVLIARHGSIRYIDEVMAVYRLHEGGVWSRGGRETVRILRENCRTQLLFYRLVNKYLDYSHDVLIREQIERMRRHWRQKIAKLLKRRRKQGRRRLAAMLRSLKGALWT